MVVLATLVVVVTLALPTHAYYCDDNLCSAEQVTPIFFRYSGNN